MNTFKQGVHRAYVPLYRVAISFSTSNKIISNMYDFDETPNSNGLCIHNLGMANIGIYVRIDKDYKLHKTSTLAHEAFHAAMAVGEMVGLEPTLTSNEEIAYILSWIVEWIEDCIKKEKKLNFKHD